MKILKSITNLIFIKFLFTYFGSVGSIYSIIFSFLKKDMNKEKRENINIKNIKKVFDIKCEFCGESYDIESGFGIYTIIRIICNMIIPGSGIFSLLYKFGYHRGIVFIGIFQFISGFFFGWFFYT